MNEAYKLMDEGQIKYHIVGRLDDYQRMGILHYIRINSGKVITKWGTCIQLAPKGTADLMIVLPAGRCLWAEIKTFKKRSKQEDTQIDFETLMRKFGHDYIIVRSPDELDAALTKRGIKIP